MLSNSCLEMASCFANIRGIADSTRVFVDNIASEVFRYNILERKQAGNSVTIIKKPCGDLLEDKIGLLDY